MERLPPGVEKRYSEEELKKVVSQIADEIIRDYSDKELLLVGVLKGAVPFLSDLMRELSRKGYDDFQIDFISVSSYGSGTESSKQPRILKDLEEDIEGRHVLLIEDIVDTGYSFDTLLKILEARSPASLKTCALLSKPDRREKDVRIDYLGIKIGDEWVEGYGMDTNEKGRGYPFIGVRKNN